MTFHRALWISNGKSRMARGEGCRFMRSKRVLMISQRGLKINSVTTNHHRLPLPPSSSFIVKAGRIVGTGREIASRMSSETHRKPITLQLHPRRELIDKNFPFGLSLSSFSLFPCRERERQKETANETILASYFEWESARIKRDRA